MNFEMRSITAWLMPTAAIRSGSVLTGQIQVRRVHPRGREGRFPRDGFPDTSCN